MILLGHSWGTVLALEYALRHPEHVSQLILMNPAPASTGDLRQFREIYIQELGPDYEQQRQIMATPAYRAGTPRRLPCGTDCTSSLHSREPGTTRSSWGE
jgi:proline iminopeptidase